MSTPPPSTSGLRCKGWQQEAALRMLENNLHPDVAENPSELVVYGGIGKAARNWPSYHAIVRELQRLGDEETLLVQSGKPVAVFETHEAAPRVLLANSNLVPEWANWDEFRRLDAAGLMMYGQMTAGSWIYIGSQGILQGTYETFAAAARKRFDGSLVGRLVVTAGLGGMGGAQPLSITMLGGTALCIEVDLQRIERRIETGYLDERAADLDDALARLEAARREGRGAVDRPRRQRRRGRSRARPARRARRHRHRPDERPRSFERLHPRRPQPSSRPRSCGKSDPDEYLRRVGESAVTHVGAIRDLAAAGAEAFDYGNALRGLAFEHGDKRRVHLPRVRPGLHPAAVLRGQGAVPLGRAVGRSGRHPRDRSRDPRPVRRPGAHRALDQARVRARPLPGPAGADLLARLRRARARRDRASTRWWPAGEVQGPIVIGRDHLDAGSVASPERETESMPTARTRSPTGRCSTL